MLSGPPGTPQRPARRSRNAITASRAPAGAGGPRLAEGLTERKRGLSTAQTTSSPATLQGTGWSPGTRPDLTPPCDVSKVPQVTAASDLGQVSTGQPEMTRRHTWVTARALAARKASRVQAPPLPSLKMKNRAGDAAQWQSTQGSMPGTITTQNNTRNTNTGTSWQVPAGLQRRLRPPAGAPRKGLGTVQADATLTREF